MHYAAIISEALIYGDKSAAVDQRKRGRASSQPLPQIVAGAWRNWWAMSVEDQPSPTARQTRVIGARGRMPGV